MICYIAGNFEAENSLNLAVTVVFGQHIYGNNTSLHARTGKIKILWVKQNKIKESDRDSSDQEITVDGLEEKNEDNMSQKFMVWPLVFHFDRQ